MILYKNEEITMNKMMRNPPLEENKQNYNLQKIH